MEPDTDRTCFEKAKASGQPTFTLIAQDVSSDLVVDFWISCQVEIRQSMEDGLTMQQAIDKARRHFGVPRWNGFEPMDDPKLVQAQEIGKAMSGWVNRKLAD